MVVCLVFNITVQSETMSLHFSGVSLTVIAEQRMNPRYTILLHGTKTEFVVLIVKPRLSINRTVSSIEVYTHMTY